jgi:gliding motility-associated-like protein
LKKLILLSGFLFSFSLAVFASHTDKFWVGGSGNWSETDHWSSHSGGTGGAGVPDKTDRVHFDAQSFTRPEQEVTLADSAFCEEFSWTNTDYLPSFRAVDKHAVLSVYGSFKLPDQEHIRLLFQGTICFRSKNRSEIDFAGNRFEGQELILNGSGTYHLENDINTNGLSSLTFIEGTFITNNYNLFFASYRNTGTSKIFLDLGKSKVTVNKSWNIQASRTLSMQTKDADIYFCDVNSFHAFKSRIPAFHTAQHAMLAGGSSPTAACAFFTITLTVTNEPCNGDCKGKIKVTVTGGSGPFTYYFFPGAPGGSPIDSISGLCANTYVAQVADKFNNKCSSQTPVTAPPSLFAFSQSTADPLCNGSCNGYDSIVPQGGTGAYVISWNTTPSQNSVKAINLCAGTYTCSVTDGNSCVTTTSVTLTDPPVLVANGASTNIKCFGLHTGKAQVTPTGGTPAYTYSWSLGGATTSSISGLAPGTYTCNVTDANGCKVVYITTITQPAAPLSGAVSSTNNPLKCNGDCNATATINASGGTAGYFYSWSPGGQATSTISALCVGSYTVTTTDANACSTNNIVSITQPQPLAITINTTNLVCNGSCNGATNAVVSGGTGALTYSWSPIGGNTPGLSNLCAGTYSVQVSDANGCSSTASATITQPAALTISMASTNVPCFGSCNGSATATLSGGTPGYTETWSPGNPTGQGSNKITNLCQGTYTLLIHDTKGCIGQQTVNITQSTQLVVNASAKNQSCAATCNGSATANPSGGATPYTFSWNPGGAGQTKTSLCAGTYTVTVTDANGCTKSQAVTVKAPVVLNVSITTTPISCNGICDGTTAANVSGGTAPYNYSWSPGGQTTASVNSQCAGSYTVTVTDSSACSFSQTVNLTQPAILAPNASTTSVACSGTCTGALNSIPTGGTPNYTYSWSPGGQTTAAVSNRCAGSYTVHVTDAHGCAQTDIVNIATPAPVSPNITASSVKCSGGCNGTATASPSGGTGLYTYSWTPGNQTTAGISGLCSGNYTCTVTDANGCKGSQVVAITQPPSLVATITNATTTCGNCQGSATVGVSGGTPGYTFSWNTLPVQTGPTATSLCVGNYTCTVTDLNACTSSVVATITQTVFINVTSSGTTLSCFKSCDGNASANASGGTPPYTYSWSPTAPVQLGQNATNLCAGTYTVTANDSNGCFNTATVNFTNPPIISPIVSKTNTTCNGLCNGTASVGVSGGTGAYTYSWTPGGQTTNTVSSLCAGTYTIDIKDSKGCDSVQTLIISKPAPILPNPVITPPSTCSACDGAITVSPSGGAGPYTYSWSPGGSINPTLSGLCTGVYTVKISDVNGCDTVMPINLNSPTGPTATLTFVAPSCNSICDATSHATVSGGSPPYTYTWSPAPGGGQGTVDASGLCAGSMNFTVKDNNGCIKIIPVVINQPAPLAITPTITNVTCGGANDGTISLAVSGGTGAYTYSWSPGAQTTPTINGLAPGNYTVQVTDFHGCSLQGVYTVTQPAILTVTVNTVNVTCHGLCNGTASTVVSGGNTPYTYSWSTGQTASNITNLCPGNYSVQITGAHGCTHTQAFSITEPGILTSSVVTTNATCSGACTGSATVTPVGGSAPYTSTWAPGSQVGTTVNSLCAGAYSVTSTDAQGCTTVSNVTITDPPPLNVTINATNTTCFGSCNGTATASVSGGTGAYAYSWSPGGQTTVTANGLCAGNYTVTVLDANACSASQTISINQPAALSSNASGNNPSCPGLCNGSATSNPVGGTPPYIYSWSNASSSQTILNLCSGSYTVQTTDSKGCTAQQAVAVSDPAPITSTNAIAPANCGVCDGTISVSPSGGTAPYTFSWTPIPGSGQGTGNISSLCAGNYVVKITDNNACVSNVTLIINNSGGPTSDTITSTIPSCYRVCDGTAQVKAVVGGTPAYTYSWYDSLNTNLGISASSVSALCAGGYILQVKDANGCLYSQPFHVGTPIPFNPHAVITQTSCSGLCNASISLSPTGGTGAYSYSWSGGLPAAATQTNLCAGSYSVQISDTHNCDSVFVFTITPQSVLLGNISITNASCGNQCNGSASVAMSSGTAPYTYQWTDPQLQTTPLATGLCSGTYTVTILDANGCNIQKSGTITAPTQLISNPVISAPACGKCNGSVTLSPTGGTTPYTYQWSSGAIGSTAGNLCAGVYAVTVKDSNGCQMSFNIPLSNPSGPGPSSIATTPASCAGTCDAAATVTPVGGTSPYTFNWQPGGQSTNSVSGLCAGLYFVQVTDAKGCIRTDSVPVLQPSSITPNQVIQATVCNACNGSIALSPSGGQAPYIYSWSGGLPTAASQSALCAGMYSVTITDAKGCSGTFVFPVNSSSGPVLSQVTTAIKCFGFCSGKDSVTASGGGGAPYLYNWAPTPLSGQGTAIASGLCPGSYTLQVTDASGCASSTSVTLNQPQALSFSAPQITNPPCNGQCTGSAIAIPSGGVSPYTFTWSGGVQTGNKDSALCAGTYTVTFQDANSCSLSQVVSVTQPPVLAFTDTTINPVCDNVATGSITVTPGGGTAPYVYSWTGPGSFSSTSQNLSGKIGGNYTLSVIDAKGCKQILNVALTPAITMEANAGNNALFCNLGAVTLDGSASMNASTYTWYEMPGMILAGNSAQLAVTPPSGTTSYQLITGNAGCTDTSTVLVTSHTPPIVFAGTSVEIFTNASTVLGGSPTSPTGIIFHWSPGTSLNDSTAMNPVANPIVTTTYTLTVTDNNGCSASDTIRVSILPQITFANGITPNADGANDVWVIDNINLFPNNVVEIYNRWGELLFQAKGYQNNWDGTYKGKPLPAGTYYYLVDLHDSTYKTKYSGPLTILR